MASSLILAACSVILAAEPDPRPDLRAWAVSPLERVWPDSVGPAASGDGPQEATSRADGARDARVETFNLESSAVWRRGLRSAILGVWEDPTSP